MTGAACDEYLIGMVKRNPSRVLLIVFDPAAIDFSTLPDLDEATVIAWGKAGDEALRAEGFDFVTCAVTTDPDEAERKVNQCVDSGPFGVALIGAGIRMQPENTLVFERLVNVVSQVWPGIAFCFNTAPNNGIEALRRWISPAGV